MGPSRVIRMACAWARADASSRMLRERAAARFGHGRISTLAVLRSRAQGRPTDAVPTAVTRGPDGAYYVGELTGDPFEKALPVCIACAGEGPAGLSSGIHGDHRLIFGPDGSLYVLQHATGPGLSGPGALIRVAPDGTRTIIASEGLIKPTAVVIAPLDAEEATAMGRRRADWLSISRTAGRAWGLARSSGSSREVQDDMAILSDTRRQARSLTLRCVCDE